MLAVIRQFHDGKQKHACGWMMGSTRISSTWGKVFGKSECSRHCCSTCFSRRYCVAPRNAFSLMQPTWTTWRSSNERRRKGRRAHHARAKSAGGGGEGGGGGGGGGRWRWGKEEEEVQRLWGMLYADDGGVVSRSPEGLERMMPVIVTACSALGLTVSKAKTEITCLQTNGGRKVPFTINAAGQVYKQTIEFV